MSCTEGLPVDNAATRFPESGKNQRVSDGPMVDRDKLRDFLITRARRAPADVVARETGIPVKTLHRWIYEDAGMPTTVNFVRLVLAYGAPFLVEVLTHCPEWIDDAARQEAGRRFDDRLGAIKAGEC